MTDQRKRHFLIFLPVWIIPVLLITVGSLINFHQNKIWGKQLLPHSFIAPRDKAKIIKILDLNNPLPDFFSPDAIQLMPVSQPMIFRISPLVFADYQHRSQLKTGLRAPPALG